MPNMENYFAYESYQWEAASQILVFGFACMIAGLVYFLATAHMVAPKYRMSSYLSGVVMVSAALILYNQSQSWDNNFVYDAEAAKFVATASLGAEAQGQTFSNGYRYLNWAIDVPMLLIQILFVVPLAAGRKAFPLAVKFAVFGTLMIGFSYVAQFFEHGFNPAAPDATAKTLFWVFYLLGWLAYFPILYYIYTGVFKGIDDRLSPRAAKLTKGIWILFLVSWTIYGFVIAIPAVWWDASGAVWRQYLFTIVDVTSKVIYGAMLGQVAMIRSAEDGYEPAVKSMNMLGGTKDEAPASASA
ncbi:MAG: bacteriorhodopsin [Planctomycetota bacterium]